MAVNESGEIPVISITSEDVLHEPNNIHSNLPLTDIEDLDSDNDGSNKNNVLLELLDNDIGVTDSEYIHTSDEEDIEQSHCVSPVVSNYSNDNITTDEFVRVICQGDPTKTQFSSSSKQCENFLGLQKLEEDGLTDFEDIEASDNEGPTILDTEQELAPYYNEQDTVTITHKIKLDTKRMNLCRRNAVFRSPTTSPYNRSDNDSSEDNLESLTVRCLGGVTDTEELDMPDSAKIQIGLTDDNAKPKNAKMRTKVCNTKKMKDSTINKNYLSPHLAKNKISKKKISKSIKEKEQNSLKVDENDDPITDVEDIYFGSADKISKTKLKTKKKTPAVPNEDSNSETSEEEEETNGIAQTVTPSSFSDDGAVTDVENVSSLESEEEKESDLPIPEVVRQKVLVREDSSEQPNIIKTVPLEDTETLGLYVPRQDDNFVTDVEDYSDDEDDNDSVILSSPQEADIPELDDYGTIETSEILRTDDIKTENTLNYVVDPITDTEEISMSSGLRRRRKPKPRSDTGAKPKSYLNVLGTKPMPYLNVTDTEEIGFSDNENTPQIKEPEGEDDATTDVEDFNISDDELDTHRRAMSRTPEFMRAMEYASTRTTERDKSMPFRKTDVCSIPEIRMLSASPDINHATHTDTEDIIGSGEEDLVSSYSRAETVTPMEMDENAVSTVSIVHTRKFDIDAPEEAIHVKGHQEDTHTDFEELEEPWGESSENVSKDEEFCVCAAPSGCVCKRPIRKNSWNYKNSDNTGMETPDSAPEHEATEQQGSDFEE